MSYDAKEASIHDSAPIECYEFVGTHATYRYTSSDTVATVNGQIYTPAAIKRSRIKIGLHDDDSARLEVELPITATVVKAYGFQVTPPRLQLNLYRVHRGDNYATDWRLIWSGVIATINITNNKAKLFIPSLFGNALASVIPSVRYMTPCNHVLFDAGCKISRGPNMVTTTVILASGTLVQIGATGGFPDGSFNGGEIAEIGKNNRRMIVGHTGDMLTINHPFATLAVGAAIEVTRGCNHAFNGDCKNRYSNQINHGGFPFIPTLNPFVDGV